ncbi:MAG TPA: AlkA N-terminal domain-containing protein [Candidatus Binatia bacterium]|nr:AlkA N-terminal domain-containing protein [Candidatus Binatia bacterium]
MEDFESRYLAVASRDRRFEGRFLVAVTSTGVYCRVGCPSRTPRRDHVRFYLTPAAAEAAGFRACRRCRPEQADPPGDRLVRGALRLIAGGGVDGRGVDAAARRLGVSTRTLHRRLTAAVGTSTLQIASSRRVQAARALIAETRMPLTDVAFAAGFNSVRRFNEVVRDELGASPSALREAAIREGEPPSDAGEPGPAAAGPGTAGAWLSLRLVTRQPFAAAPLLGFLAARAVSGVEAASASGYARSVRAPRGAAVVDLTPDGPHVTLRVRLDDIRDLEDVVRRCRRLLDLDADPVALTEALGADALIGPLVAAAPGLRVPGSVDPFETAVRAVLGQQVSVAAARTLAGRLVGRLGDRLPLPSDSVTHLFPSPRRLAEADLDGLGLTGRRIESIRALSRAVLEGDLDLAGGSPDAVEAALARLPGFGPWTRAYIAMRGRGDPDAIPVSDLGLRRAMQRLGQPADPASLAARAEAWRPWRAYAALHLWNRLSTPVTPPPGVGLDRASTLNPGESPWPTTP